MRQANVTADFRAARRVPGLARAYAGVATPHVLCPDPGLRPRARKLRITDHELRITNHEDTKTQRHELASAHARNLLSRNSRDSRFTLYICTHARNDPERRGTETPPYRRCGICRVHGDCHGFGICCVFRARKRFASHRRLPQRHTFLHLHFALPHGFCICFFLPHQALSTKHYALFLSHQSCFIAPRAAVAARRHKEAHDRCSRRRMGLGPCRGAFRTDRAAGALAEFASARSRSNPWRDCPARRCSPAQTRGPAVSTCAARDCFVEGFAECGPRISRLRIRAIRAIRGSLFSGLPGPPDFRRLPRFPHLWHQFPQAHGFVRRAAIPAYLEDPDNRAAAFSRDACFVPQRIHGVSCCPKEPRGVLLLDCYLSRTGPGAGTKKRPARGRMGFTLWRAAQNARAPFHFMPMEVSLT